MDTNDDDDEQNMPPSAPMSPDQAMPTPRILLCLSCGLGMPVPDEGGSIPCSSCGTHQTFETRPGPRPSRLPKPELPATLEPSARKELRLSLLRRQLEEGTAEKSPYATFDAPEGLEHLELAYDDPTLPGVMTQAFARALDRCKGKPGDFAAERRLHWIASKTRNSMAMRGQVHAARPFVEQAREIVQDPGLQHAIYCMLADFERKAGDLMTAEQLLAFADPDTTILHLDNDYRSSVGMVALTRGNYARALELVGEDNDAWPWEEANKYQACMMRAAALEGLGRQADADEAFRMNHETLGDDMIKDWLAGSEALAQARPVWDRARGQGGGDGGLQLEELFVTAPDPDKHPYRREAGKLEPSSLAELASPAEPQLAPSLSEMAPKRSSNATVWALVALTSTAAFAALLYFLLRMSV